MTATSRHVVAMSGGKDPVEVIARAIQAAKIRGQRMSISDEYAGNMSRAVLAALEGEGMAVLPLEPSDDTIKGWVERLWHEAKTGGGWSPDWAEIIRAAFRCARNEAKEKAPPAGASGA